jgi:hypothetical protein
MYGLMVVYSMNDISIYLVSIYLYMYIYSETSLNWSAQGLKNMAGFKGWSVL